MKKEGCTQVNSTVSLFCKGCASIETGGEEGNKFKCEVTYQLGSEKMKEFCLYASV